MESGVYRKIEGHTGVGLLYQFVCLAREHTTGEEAVVYIPLRVEPSWAGTVRFCYVARASFERKFVYVGEGLPHETDSAAGRAVPDVADPRLSTRAAAAMGDAILGAAVKDEHPRLSPRGTQDPDWLKGPPWRLVLARPDGIMQSWVVPRKRMDAVVDAVFPGERNERVNSPEFAAMVRFVYEGAATVEGREVAPTAPPNAAPNAPALEPPTDAEMKEGARLSGCAWACFKKLPVGGYCSHCRMIAEALRDARVKAVAVIYRQVIEEPPREKMLTAWNCPYCHYVVYTHTFDWEKSAADHLDGCGGRKR